MNHKKSRKSSKGASSQKKPQGLHKLAPQDSPIKKNGVGARLRTSFLTGLIVVGPVGITVYIVWTFVSFIDSWVNPLLPKVWRPETYGYWIPGMGVVFSIIVLMIVGALAANLFGRTIVSLGERIVGRMPVVRGVYGALKQIFETVLSQSQTSFQKVGIIEYPRRGLYSIVFVSTETTGEIAHKCDAAQEGMTSIFLPTTPNPTSGFLLFVPNSDVLTLDMKVEDAAKLVISAGLVAPEYNAHGLGDLAGASELADLSPTAAQAQIGAVIGDASSEAENSETADRPENSRAPSAHAATPERSQTSRSPLPQTRKKRRRKPKRKGGGGA